MTGAEYDEALMDFLTWLRDNGAGGKYVEEVENAAIQFLKELHEEEDGADEFLDEED